MELINKSDWEKVCNMFLRKADGIGGNSLRKIAALDVNVKSGDIDYEASGSKVKLFFSKDENGVTEELTYTLKKSVSKK